MEILLDNKPLAIELQGANLQDLINDLVINHLGSERTLREVKINGKLYEEAELGMPTAVSREIINRLEVETLETRQVVLHFLSNADAYLQAIIVSTEKVAELFRVADEREANEHYLRTLDSLQLFLQVLSTSRQALMLDFDLKISDGKSAEQHLTDLSGLVEEMLNAQEQQDWVLLADLLQYDLVHELRLWREIVPQLKEQVLS